ASRRLQRIVPLAVIDVGWQECHAVRFRVIDQLGRGIETHRQRVEDSRSEDIRVMTFEIARDIDQVREGGAMTFRKTVRAETGYLARQMIRIFGTVAVAEHARDETRFGFGWDSLTLEGGHASAEPVGFGGRETGGF